MRKVLLLLLALSALGLTTAVAADFDVQTEDITSFSMPASIPVPGTYYLIGDPANLPGTLSTTAESNTNDVESKDLDPGGLLATEPVLDETTDPPTWVRYLAPEARATHKHDWATPMALGSPLTIVSPTVRLYITETAKDAPLKAGLFDCPADLTSPTGCKLIAEASGTPDQNEVEVTFGDFSYTVPSTNRLYVRIVNTGTNTTKIQWGYKENRPARLELNVQP